MNAVFGAARLRIAGTGGMRMLFHLGRPALAAILIAGLAGCAEMNKELARDSQKAPYVPTPMSYVDRMLTLAEPGPGDVLYDLGSGDGRIPIGAAQKYGIRKGVGIDIDAGLVKLANENAARAGVADRATFIRADVFEADFSDATIVTLYLLPDMNVRLRPRLLALKPGTRIVAHRFGLGDWQPDRSILADENAPRPLNWTEDDIHRLMLYVVPGRAEGAWRGRAQTGGALSLRLEQRYQKLSGSVDLGDGPLRIRSGRLDGSRVSIELADRGRGRDATVRLDGEISGDTMRGTVVTGGGKTAFAATRAR
jgi:SAM-dependent methyltransferase